MSSLSRFVSLRLRSALLFAGALLVTLSPAQAQITAISPFVGTHSESWESFPNYLDGGFSLLPDPTPIMNGEAAISNPEMLVYEPFVADALLGSSGIAQTADGSKGLQIGVTQPTATLTFLNPVAQFGAYWGAETFGFPTTVNLDFFDDAQNLVGSEQFDYDHEATGDGGLDWHGWRFDAPIASLTFTGVHTTLDGLQVTAVPEPGGLALLLSGGMVGVGLLVQRRKNRKFGSA